MWDALGYNRDGRTALVFSYIYECLYNNVKPYKFQKETFYDKTRALFVVISSMLADYEI